MAENAAVRDNEVMFTSFATTVFSNGSNYDEELVLSDWNLRTLCFRADCRERW
jgi:hypothetical protein